MTYHELFARAAERARRRGAVVEFERGPALSDAAVEEARRVLTLPLPESLVEFYREMGDGMVFRWAFGGFYGEPALDDQGNEQPFAMVEFAPLLEVAQGHEDHKRLLAAFQNDHDYPFTDDPAKARATALRMRWWLGFRHEGNGDRFCLDTAVSPEPVVFDKHDWADGGTGDNGWLMGDTFRGFMEGWSRVCFQFPGSLWWQSVLTPAGVDWESDEFDPRFRFPRDWVDPQLHLPL